MTPIPNLSQADVIYGNSKHLPPREGVKHMSRSPEETIDMTKDPTHVLVDGVEYVIVRRVHSGSRGHEFELADPKQPQHPDGTPRIVRVCWAPAPGGSARVVRTSGHRLEFIGGGNATEIVVEFPIGTDPAVAAQLVREALRTSESTLATGAKVKVG